MRTLLIQLMQLQLSSSNEMTDQLDPDLDLSEDRGCSIALLNSRLLFSLLYASTIVILTSQASRVLVRLVSCLAPEEVVEPEQERADLLPPPRSTSLRAM